MESRILRRLSIAILVTLFSFTPLQFSTAQEMEIVLGGELEYQNYCAVCHGVDARGDGIMRKFLTLPPTNLTQLAKKNGDKFPFLQVFRTIDGREEVSSHGTRTMPIWGARFRADAGGNDPGAKAQTAGRILSLVFYLQHIQE